jgi:Repeat of unknown function (DUF5648)
MLLKCLRFGLLGATLVITLHVAAATRYWTLTGVQFEDGALATGYFGYDDATNTIANWNIRVSGGRSFLAFTYTPGNSHQARNATGLDLWSYNGEFRTLWVGLPTPLDGSNATVSIAPATGSEASGFFIFAGEFEILETRAIITGSLAFTPLPPPVAIVQVDEFYHSGLRHYFITADTAEKQDLDPVTGVHRGWVRTGESFKAYATGSSASGSRLAPDSVYPGSVIPVCRHYGDPMQDLDSHFYSASAGECEKVNDLFGRDWLFESDNVFQIDRPDTNGACRAGTMPVYRLWNQRKDSNHRYTTSAAIKAQMIAAGYVAEGYGPDGVVMCAVQ